MPFRYQRRSEVLAVYAIDPLGVIGERRAGVSRRRDRYRAGLGTAGTDLAKHGDMAGVAPAEQDFSKIEASHSYICWGEIDKSLGVFRERRRIAPGSCTFCSSHMPGIGPSASLVRTLWGCHT